MQVNQAAVRVAVAALTMSAAGFATWVASEGTGPTTVRADGQVMHRGQRAQPARKRRAPFGVRPEDGRGLGSRRGR